MVAHSLLPYEFAVKANGNGPSSSRKRTYRPVRQHALQPRSNPSLASALESRLPEPLASSYPVSVDELSQHNSDHASPVLRKLSPADGPVSGGPTIIIMISGIDSPPPTQQIVYARFGNVVVPTVRLIFLSQQNTDSIHRPGKIPTRSSASYLLPRPRGQSKLPSLYTRSPKNPNSARATAGSSIIRDATTCQ